MASRFLCPRWPCAGSRQQAILHRSPRCGRRWRTRSACASRANEARASSIRLWYRRCSTASSPPGCCGRGKDRVRQALQLARSGLAPARAGAARAVPAVVRSRTPATARSGRGAGLDFRRARPGGTTCVLRTLQRGRGGTLFLRAVPEGLRSRVAEAAGRLVHADRGGPLHGEPRGQGAEGRPQHRRRSCGGQRVCARPLLRHRRLSRRSPAPHRRQLPAPGTGCARRRAREAGGDAAGIRLRDNARAVRCRPPASRVDDAGARRSARRRRMERPGVFLTNALTGWEPEVQKPLPFPELEEERDRAGA